MTHNQRILADRLLAVPVAFFFNGIARVLGKVLRRDHSIASSNVRHIVVAKLIGMGSILQATPLLKALKRKFPNATITFVTMRSNRELLSRLFYVDEVLVLDDRSLVRMGVSTLHVIAALLWHRADLYFDLEVYSAFASLLALWAVTRNRIGFYRHSVTFKRGIYTHLVYFNTRMAVRQLYFQLGRVVGVPPGEPDSIGPIRVDDQSRTTLRSFLSEAPQWQQGSSYIVVNPNASDLLLERRWPIESFAETLEQIVGNGYQIALIGVRDERSYVQGLIDRLSPEASSHVVNTAGRLTLGELFALLEGAACVLTNDTGPMHMSIALQRPTVCLFGPANPEHYGQDLDYVEIFYNKVFCSPCLYEADATPCHGNNICMQMIQPGPVADAVLRLASYDSSGRDSRHEKYLSRLLPISDAPDGSPLGVVARTSLIRIE
ncbi:MAG TPA: glycosyltransferase family 9 protein [Candidatus Acidoferrales bacterium]|nr:glycosyltransferase family 9 protein [Candidatus Acidoferrales bacterium]